jgi:hypothetical protein
MLSMIFFPPALHASAQAATENAGSMTLVDTSDFRGHPWHAQCVDRHRFF